VERVRNMETKTVYIIAAYVVLAAMCSVYVLQHREAIQRSMKKRLKKWRHKDGERTYL
jgi:hypothetical protein